MYKLSQAYPLPQIDPRWRELVFFDIETTGFSRTYHMVGLITLAFIHDDQLELIQYFAESSDEEALILTLAVKELNQHLAYVSYNGDRFDIPFVNQRLKHHSVGDRLNPKRSIDLYRVGKLGTLKQTEESSGYDRSDTLSGADWAKGYTEYLVSPSVLVRDALLLHNRDDVLSLVQLLSESDAHQKKIEDCIVLTSPAMLLGQITKGTANLRVQLHNAFNESFTVDLPLLETPDFSILDHPRFDELDHSGKKELVLIEHGELKIQRIRRLMERSEFT